MRIRYRFVGAVCLNGGRLTAAEERTVTELGRNGLRNDRFELPEANPKGGDVIYPSRWAPNSYVAALGKAARRRDEPPAAQRS